MIQNVKMTWNVSWIWLDTYEQKKKRSSKFEINYSKFAPFTLRCKQIQRRQECEKPHQKISRLYLSFCCSHFDSAILELPPASFVSYDLFRYHDSNVESRLIYDRSSLFHSLWLCSVILVKAKKNEYRHLVSILE